VVVAFTMLVPGSEDEKEFVAQLLKKHEKRIQRKNPDKKISKDINSIMKK
jgi:hypothetical protein